MAYVGPRIRLSQLITRPRNGIVQQSQDAVSYTPGLRTNPQRNHEVNADGFGISFYDTQNKPHTYRNTKPAWSDSNLKTLCDNIDTHVCLAHVRAASSGPVTDVNCHPFTFGDFTFMHNGGIGGFQHIKRPLSEMFPDPIWHNIQGSTDSEYCFHYFLTLLFRNKDENSPFSPEQIADALRQTINGLMELQRKYCHAEDLNEQSASMNFCVTNGSVLIASRMRRPREEDSPSLYVGTGNCFRYDEGTQEVRFCHASDTPDTQRTTIICSEPLTKVEQDWTLVPEETLLKVDARGNVALQMLI